MTRLTRVWLLLAFSTQVVVSAQQTPVRDQPRAQPVGTAVIGGVVTADEPGSRPLRQAIVMVVGAEAGVIRLTATDDTGRFLAAALPAGRYLVSASKPPYVDIVYGAKETGLPGTAIVMKDGERRVDLALKLARGGVITGTITDDHGQPVVGVSVDLQQPRASAGESMLQQVRALTGLSRPMTDDRGVYRFSGLAPGEYAVSVTPRDSGGGEAVVLTAADIDAGLRAAQEQQASPATRSTGATIPASTVITGQSAGAMGGPTAILIGPRPVTPPADAQTSGYAPVYYPGTTDLSDATVITVGPGDERTGVDVVARLVPTTRVEGVVLGADGQPARSVTVRARPAGRSNALSSILAGFGPAGLGRLLPDGRFVVSGLPPGKHIIEARTTSAPLPFPVVGLAQPAAPSGPQFWAQAEITASGQPISGLVLQLQPGVTVSGRINVDATTLEPPKDLSTVMISVRPTAFEVLAVGAGSTRASADGTFTVTGLVPGPYFIAATMINAETPADALAWLGQRVTVDGRDVSDLPIDVKAGEDIKDVVITMTDRQQELSGTLQDPAGRPAPDYTVVLFPADRKYWVPNSRRILTTRPGTDGKFAFDGPLGPPPGDYLLAAVTDLRTSQQFDPAFLDAVSAAAIKIAIAPGQKKLQDVRIVGR